MKNKFPARIGISIFIALLAVVLSRSISAFLRTHPTDATRIKQLAAWMPEALAQYHPVP